MMGGLKSPTMNRQDRQTRNAIKRNQTPNETRPHTLGIGPKPQNARTAKSKTTAVHNILKNISHLPLMLRDDRRPHRFQRRIYASITGYGQSGPWQGRMAYAPTVQAEAGFTHNSIRHYGEVLGEPRTDSLSHADVYAGLRAASPTLQ